MNKFKGILICTDLDGTLFNSEHTVSKRNSEAIEYFKSEGGLFTFITGRPPRTCSSAIELIRPNAPIGCFNGVATFDQKKGECELLSSLDATALDICDYVSDRVPEAAILAYTPDATYFCKCNSATDRYASIVGYRPEQKGARDITEPILKLIFASLDESVVSGVIDALKMHPSHEDYDYIRSEAMFYELLPKGLSKGGLLLRIADKLGIDRMRTIAVGDYNNDISMVKAAGVGYAVANAVDELKAAADRITVSNDEDAIARIIEDLDSGLLDI